MIINVTYCYKGNKLIYQKAQTNFMIKLCKANAQKYTKYNRRSLNRISTLNHAHELVILLTLCGISHLYYKLFIIRKLHKCSYNYHT